MVRLVRIQRRICVERIRDGQPTTLGAASGIVAGLVGITPACASVSPWGAVIIGIVCGAVCALAVSLKYRFGYDDSLDVGGEAIQIRLGTNDAEGLAVDVGSVVDVLVEHAESGYDFSSVRYSSLVLPKAHAHHEDAPRPDGKPARAVDKEEISA